MNVSQEQLGLMAAMEKNKRNTGMQAAAGTAAMAGAGAAGGAASGGAEEKSWKADEAELNRLKTEADNLEQAYTAATKKQEQMEKDLADRRTMVINAYAAARKSGNQQAQEFAEALLNGYKEFYNGDYKTASTNANDASTAYKTAYDSYKSYADKWNAWVKEQQKNQTGQANTSMPNGAQNSSQENAFTVSSSPAMPEEQKRMRQKYLWSKLQNSRKMKTSPASTPAFAETEAQNPAHGNTYRSSEAVQADLDTLEKQYTGTTLIMSEAMAKGNASTEDIMGWANELKELEGRKNALQEELSLSEYLEYADKYFKYADLKNLEDFETLSQYATTANGKEPVMNSLAGIYTETGFDDLTYDYINRNKTASDKVMVNGIGNNTALLGLDQSYLEQMNDDEIAIFNYLYATQGADAAYEYTAFLTSDLTSRQRLEQQTQWAEDAREDPLGTSVFSVLMSPAKGMSYLGQAADYLADGKIDQNAAYNKFSYIPTTIRQTVPENWGPVGSFAYQTGLGMADFLLTTAVSGGNEALSLAIMGSGAAADTTIAAKDRGLNDDQAFALGSIAGAAEVITEKVSIDTLLNANLLADGKLKYILKNALAEGSEEVGSDLINLMADILISRDKSEWKQSMDAYMADGKTEGEAFGLALADQAAAMGVDFLGGSISGGVMGSGGSLIFNNSAKKPGSEINGLNQSEEDTQAFSDMGLESDQEAAVQGPEEPPVSYMENFTDMMMPVQSALTAYRNTGTVSSRMTEIILGQSKAVQELTEKTGIEITGTKSQQRNAVRQAVAALAAQQDAAKVREAAMARETETEEERKARNLNEAIRDYILGPEQSNVDNSNGNNYADATTAQGGTDNARAETVGDRGNGQHQENNTAGQITGSTENGRGYVQSGDQGRTTGGNGRETVHTSDSEGRGITREQADRLRGTAVRDRTERGHAPDGFEAMGAASAGFSGAMEYNDLLRDGNVQPSRATDAKYEEAPIRDSYGRKVTEFAHNVIDSEAISERDVGTVKRLVADGAFGQDVQKMDAVRQTAVDKIRDRKPGYVANAVTEAVNDGKFNEHTVAEAEVLFAYYTNRGGEDAAARAEEMLLDLSQMATSTGRQLNMFKLLRRLTPEGQMGYIRQNIDHEVDKINSKRSRKKQVQVEIPQELQDDYLEAARDVMDSQMAVQATVAKTAETGLEEDIPAAAEKALAEIDSQNSKDANMETNDMAERVGKRVADSLTRQAQRQELSVEDILYQEIMRFANDKAEAGRTKTQSATSTANLDTLRDYYRYQPFFQSAWNTARDRVEQAMFSMQDGDPRISVIEQFLASGDEALGIENWNPIGAMDSGNPKSTVRRAAKEAANAAGIRMDNSAGRDDTRIRQQMRDVLTENAHDKEAAAREIARIAVNEAGLSDAAAEAMAEDVMRAFYNDLSQRSARRVSELFGTDKTQRQTVQKTMAEKLGELYNLGAFSNEQYRQAAFDSIFGEGSGITVSDKLLERFVNAAGEEQAAAENAIYAYVAAQIPATIEEKLDAWRHLCMLGNVKTQERNFSGSAAFQPMVAIRRSISAGLQRMVLQQENRTRAILGMGKDARKLLSWAKTDARSKAAQEAMKYSGYTGNQARSKIDDYRTIFKFKPLEASRTGLQSLMEGTDMVWKKKEYARSLAGFLKARGYTAEQVQNGNVPTNVMQEGREQAVQDAMKATFNDSNKFSDALSRTRFKGNGTLSRVGNIMLKGTAPYLRTPANIVVRYVEYSPAGLLNGFDTLIRKVQNGDATVAQGLDEIAASLTGTGAMLLGAALRYGLIPGVRLWGDVDDEEAEAMNVEPYSLQIGSTCYGMEFLAPATITMFTGANIAQKFEKYGGFENMDGWDVVSALAESTASGLNPLLEMSVLSSLNDIVQNVAYEDTAGDKVIALVTSAATNYLMQFLPTLGGHLERATEENQKIAYSDADNAIQRSVEKTIGRATQKIPGIDLFQADKVDSHGNVVRYGDNWFARIADAVVNPTTVTKIDDGPVAAEIGRLNQLPDTNVSAPAISQTISYTDNNGKKHKNERLTADQYTTIQSVTRKTAETILEAMVTSDDYKALTDEQKAEAFGYAYDYAREMGRTAAIQGYDGMEIWMEGIEGSESEAIIRKVATASFTNAVDSLKSAWREDKDDAKAMEALESAYQVYAGMSEQMQKTVLSEAPSSVQEYIEARESGESVESYAAIQQPVLLATDGMTDVAEAIKAGGDYSGAIGDLDMAYGKYLKMSGEQKEEVMGKLSSRAGQFFEAKAAGVSTETFLKLYETYYTLSNDENVEPFDGAQEWASTLQKAVESGQITQSQANTMKDKMLFWQTMPAEATTYNKLTDAGISADTADDMMWLLDGIEGTGKYNPETEKNYVRDIDKMEALAQGNAGTDEEVEMVIRLLYLDDKQEEKLDAMLDMGYDVGDYVVAYRVQLDNDTKAEFIAAMIALGCSNQEATNLYYMFNPK